MSSHIGRPGPVPTEGKLQSVVIRPLSIVVVIDILRGGKLTFAVIIAQTRESEGSEPCDHAIVGSTLHLTFAIFLAFIYIASVASRDPRESNAELMSETIHALEMPVRSYKSMDTHERQKRIDDLFERRYIMALLYREQRPTTASRPTSSSHGSVQVDVGLHLYFERLLVVIFGCACSRAKFIIKRVDLCQGRQWGR